jgi:4a-hydroxytetrahydrobiopterin dehydratase
MSEAATRLAAKKCKPCQRGDTPLSPVQIEGLLRELDGWTLREGAITKTFRFADYWQTMAFVNATAWISQREDHHPDLHVGFNTCRIDYCTHAIGGLSENDFICAAKVDALLRL